ncbi:MAG TPA: PAS domain-containing protein [Candidatus Acidoferrum sp.]|nr:PAS domain-containing protein [Candidatus Acidoferrum sp.]
MEKAETIRVQPNSGTAVTCRFSGCIMPAMASSGQGSERVNSQLLVDSIPALIHTARLDGYLDYFNKPWLEYLGVTLDKVTGWNWTAFVHPEDVEGILAKWRACLATGEIFEFETRVRRADGEYRWMFHRKVPLRDANGDIVKWYGSSLDIEERKMAEEQLRRNAEGLQRSEFYLAEGQRLAHTGSWAWNVRTDALFWSEEIFRIYGYSPQETGPTWEKLLQRVHPEDRAQIQQRAKMEARGEECVDSYGDFRIILPDGTMRYLHSVAHPVTQSGEVTEVIGTLMDVTEHELLTQELRRREAYLAEAQKLSHTGSFGWKPDTGEIVWSDETYRIFEYDRSVKLTIDSVVQRVHPEERDDFLRVIDRASGGATHFEHTYRLLFPDGRVKHIHALAHVVQDACGNREFVGAGIDVTERKRAEQALGKSEAYLAEAQRLSQTGSWAWSPDRDITYWSEQCYRVLSFDPQDGLPRFEDFFQRIHPNDQPGVRELIEMAIREKAEWEADYRIVHPDGPVRDVHVLGHPVLSTSGHLVEFVGTVIDVTERKRAEEERRRSEMELRQIVDLAPQFVAVFGPNRKGLFVNRIALDYFGLTLEEWRQRFNSSLPYSNEFLHPDDRERITGDSDRAFFRGAAFGLEMRLRKSDGSYRWFFLRYNPLHDEQGQITRWYVTGTDIEDRKLAEDRLRQENVALREEIDKASMFEEIVGTSPALKSVLSLISKVAPSDSTVLITGETGTGKELVARAIHRRSDRASRAFISVNCAAIPRDLIASELFGHEKGAFTGAIQQRLGRFELANGGTLFLDEVGELPAETQIALLRVLQEQEFERVGGSRRIRTDVRVIAATNRNLQAAISTGSFRSDLFYRLHVFPIEIPPLRARGEDIPLIVEYFIDCYARKAGKNIKRVNKKTLELLQSYPWPGNIRELQNVIERSVILCETDIFSIDESWLPLPSAASESKRHTELPRKLEAQEKNIIEEALRASRGRVFGPTGAAAKLGIPRSTLESKIRALKIDKNRFKTNPES